MPIQLDPGEAFAARYRAFVARAFDRFEFFGVDPLGIPRRHAFDRGYHAPTLVAEEPASASPATAGERADRAVAPLRRILVRGVAGSGKTTLLRWLGWQAAKAEPADEPPPVPFLLELGLYLGASLPALEQLVPAPLRAEMPAGWVASMLADGRVLLLLDGLDEVPVAERAQVQTWLSEHLLLNENIRCVVSTRPSVVAEQLWVDEGFGRFHLLPMSRYNIERFVRGWHGVARADYPADTPGDRDARAWLDECEHNLLRTLANRPALGGMSANPLLCGLLCALYREDQHVPENRKDVYDAALELLMVRWPNLRRRRRGSEHDGTGEQGDIGLDVRLNAQELQKLLQRLAFWMVTNHERVLNREAAPNRVRSSMAGLREDDPDRVLQYLSHDCGLLRELPDQSLQFLHRTFRDHLAAKEVVDEENINLMLNLADQPHWHDVVVMAGAHARPKERARILRDLLQRAEGAANRETFVLLAMAVLEQAPVLPADQPEVRALVEDAMRALVPPRSVDAADRLADVGPLVLDLLPDPEQLPADAQVLVVRTLAGIAAGANPSDAAEWMGRLMARAPRPVAKRMIEQSLMVWGRRGDYESYAEDVLAKLPIHRVRLTDPTRIKNVGHVEPITSLTVSDQSLGLSYLTGLTDLRFLRLVRHQRVRLDPLANMPSLRTLELEACATMQGNEPIDLSPIARTSLRRLRIFAYPTRVDLAGLAGARLRVLRLDGGSVGGNPTLPGCDVRCLVLLVGRRHRVDFTAVRGVRTLVIDRHPDADELAALPDLERLIVVAPSGPN